MLLKINGIMGRFTPSSRRQTPAYLTVGRVLNHWNNLCQIQAMSTLSEEAEAKEFLDFIHNLKNYEKVGVPIGSGTDSIDGFDLGRMRRLMQLLGNPQCNFKSVHIAGTKGKGSTAAFLSNILRAQGYSVGCYTSPHIRTIMERITLGASGGPIAATLLNHHFQSIRRVLEQAVDLENGLLTHFEVLTALAFSLFAQQGVDIAVIEAGLGGERDATNIIPSSALAASIITTIGEEHLAALGGSLESIAVAKSGIIKARRPLVLGGPFLPQIERILRDKATSMSSPVVSASDTGNRSILRSFDKMNGRPYQLCDLVLQIQKDLQLCIEMFNVKLSMLGQHQLKNAATATCAALCLRDQGWRLSDESIRAGLESAFLVGRNQILTPYEAKKLGLPGASIMLDGAHTKDSAGALVNTVEMAFPGSCFVLVVAMANDKDHIGFAREVLSAASLEAVLFTEVSIAGERSRTTPASNLRELWFKASKEKGIHIVDYSMNGVDEEVRDSSLDQTGRRAVIFSEGSLVDCIRAGGEILGGKPRCKSPVIVVTGSLHIVSALLSFIERQ